MIWETSSEANNDYSNGWVKTQWTKNGKNLDRAPLDRSWVVDVAEFERRRGGHPGGSEG